MYYYRAFGLNIACEWSIFQLPEAEFEEGLTDVFIGNKNVSEDGIENPRTKELDFFQTNSTTSWLSIDDVARFLVSDGNKILVDAHPACDQQTINLYLLGTGLGLILHQRKQSLLHGNAIKIGDKAIVIVAHSGVGKSTLASEFYRRGFQLLADDVCTIDENRMVQPSYPYLKLWQDAIDRLDIDPKQLIKITAQKDKYYAPIGKSFQTKALPLSKVYILSKDTIKHTIGDKQKGIDKIHMLIPHVYRLGFLRQMHKGSPAFERLVASVGPVPITHITRPNEGQHVEEIAQLIIDDVLGH